MAIRVWVVLVPGLVPAVGWPLHRGVPQGVQPVLSCGLSGRGLTRAKGRSILLFPFFRTSKTDMSFQQVWAMAPQTPTALPTESLT